MASGIYSIFKANLMNKVVDLEGDTINVMLLDDSHTFTATDDDYNAIDANELANGNGYTSSGAALASKAVTEGTTTKFDAADSTWTSATFTAYHAVIYDITAASNLICSIDFGGAVTVSAGTLTIQWHTDGIITLA